MRTGGAGEQPHECLLGEDTAHHHMPGYKSSKEPLAFEAQGPKAHAIPDATKMEKPVSRPAQKFDPEHGMTSLARLEHFDVHFDHNRDLLPCKICGRTFTYAKRRDDHEKTCGAPSSSLAKGLDPWAKARLAKGARVGVKELLCKVCGKAFAYAKRLADHEQMCVANPLPAMPEPHWDGRPTRGGGFAPATLQSAAETLLHLRNDLPASFADAIQAHPSMPASQGDTSAPVVRTKCQARVVTRDDAENGREAQMLKTASNAAQKGPGRRLCTLCGKIHHWRQKCTVSGAAAVEGTSTNSGGDAGELDIVTGNQACRSPVETLEALDAAVGAWNKGKGESPLEIEEMKGGSKAKAKAGGKKRAHQQRGEDSSSSEEGSDDDEEEEEEEEEGAVLESEVRGDPGRHVDGSPAAPQVKASPPLNGFEAAPAASQGTREVGGCKPAYKNKPGYKLCVSCGKFHHHKQKCIEDSSDTRNTDPAAHSLPPHHAGFSTLQAAGLQGAATCADSSPGSHRQKRCASPLLSDQAAKSLKTDAWAYRCGPGATGAPTSEHRPVAFIPVSSEAVTPAKFQLLKQLLREGDITQSEYEDKRKELLARI